MRGWILCALLLTRGSAEPSKTASVDACIVAPAEQLRFVVAAGVGRYFPIRGQQGGGQHPVALLDPAVVAAACPMFHLDLRARLERGNLKGDVRVTLALLTDVTYRGESLTAASLTDASLCVRRVERVELGGQQPSGFDARALLEQALVSRACFDVTSLVYAFLLQPPKHEPE